ncbi:MAG: hypothetical protein ACK55I_14270, partial [bacterium]
VGVQSVEAQDADRLVRRDLRVWRRPHEFEMRRRRREHARRPARPLYHVYSLHIRSGGHSEKERGVAAVGERQRLPLLRHHVSVVEEPAVRRKVLSMQLGDCPRTTSHH